MRNLIQRFLRDTGGAITTEFVVVAGALVGLSIASVAAVQLGATNMAGNYDMGATRGAGGVLCMFSNANDCAPGATDTPQLSDPARAASPVRLPPLGRLISPEEVAATVAFLVGAEAGAITGQTIVQCGGASLAAAWPAAVWSGQMEPRA